ncbi:Maf/Ham1 [Violaceomyces palustris]|uniref:Maf/Ham1 n=1 Tax=Violaceomyces palustris TaxID=1673888 RepID=A0ACD0NPM8_9BASI|nr:Maf/Ham1 [Violaceomyces palustris]
MGSSASSSSSNNLADQRPDPVSDYALKIPAFTKLSGKRVILASNSPRRKEILASVGLFPEIIPSTFEEDLPKSEFRGEASYEYPVETSARKALEVYQRLVKESPEDPPDLVIGADTVVVKDEEILEKPSDPTDNLRMLAELNGSSCQVISGVTIVYPILKAPGFEVRSLSERTKVKFADNPTSHLRAYIDCGEGMDRAGGFAIQGRASILISSIQGDYNNVVGFPLFSFTSFLDRLVSMGELELED